MAGEVLALARSRPPTLGTGRLVCLDGPAGTGKTTLAAAIADRAGPDGCEVVHADDLYAGWSGLGEVAVQLDSLLPPLAEGRPGAYRRWDWHASAWAGTVTVAPSPLLLVEGVGSWAAAHAARVTVLVWLTAPVALRRDRVLARDGATVAPHLDAWSADEDAHHRAQGTEAHADLVVDAAAARD
ncbi:AAA family ATPase [Nocardioides sp. CFH 31398]|uniref:AAA family ATPase n=1 Tax=Nocardioides sp. CFH 31398 TaxID=2919579 RepID=UPI001F069B00|nr:AAA family ATPase [Nocardioides sp. CFH 31398]MCH1868555.1 4-amino-4-deoxy-L-arabinose transferase [Nocardioides sp. CFH 31398]MCH1868972.1 4-amino-4-deoxy-L-arabinose transferase [Nocardioides sp. CFH 31398]